MRPKHLAIYKCKVNKNKNDYITQGNAKIDEIAKTAALQARELDSEYLYLAFLQIHHWVFGFCVSVIQHTGITLSSYLYVFGCAVRCLSCFSWLVLCSEFLQLLSPLFFPKMLSVFDCIFWALNVFLPFVFVCIFWALDLFLTKFLHTVVFHVQ